MPEQTVVHEKMITFCPRAFDRDSAIAELAGFFHRGGVIADREADTAAVLEREAVSSTDTGIGVAIPHGKGAFVNRTAVAISRFKEAIRWGGREKTVRAVFLLAVDDDAEGLAHLAIISRISTMLMDDDFLDLLYTADSEHVLFDEIERRLEEEE